MINLREGIDLLAATLKTWKILTKRHCCPRHATTAVTAALGCSGVAVAADPESELAP
jgi:hypothetical protein